MSESMLKRDWKEADVQRLRNLVQGKHGEQTKTQSGYKKSLMTHIDGDVWEENGRQWIMKDGIKQTVNKLDEYKRFIVLPILCPKCFKAMKSNQINKYMYKIHGICFDCVIKHETELKRLGQFEEYQKNIIHQNIRSHIKELEDMLLEISINPLEESFVTEAGDIEAWKGGKLNITQISNEIQEYIQKLKDIIDN